MNRRRLRPLQAVILAWAMGGAAEAALLAERLPVFKLAEPKADAERATRVLAGLNKGQALADVKVVDRPDVVGRRAGNKLVEVDRASGGVFARDFDRLWNPRIKPALPPQAEARKHADSFLKDNRLAPASDQRLEVSFASFSETGVVADAPGAVPQKLDVQVNYKVDVKVNRGGKEERLPIVGGGGKFKVAVGERGDVIGYHGVWRDIAGVGAEEEILPQAQAEAQVKGKFQGLRLTRTESFLAYYAAPAFERQTHLAPVWVVKAEAEIGGQKVPLRNTIVAATKFGPSFPAVPARPRGKDERPRPDSLDKDERSAASQTSALGLLTELLRPRAAWAQDATFEAGTSWIGPSQGLGGSPANAKGFVDGLAAGGWKVNFNWGEAAAFESDWRANDDAWVDAADFVFYTGHANSDGWVLNPPGDTFLHFNEVGATPGSPNDHYGNTDIEWIIIAACGPHQSNHFVGSVGNAFDRWRGIFDGLHVFLGYGAVTYDNTTEGSRVVQLARAGWPVIDAWFRAAWEIQPSTNGFSAPNGPTIFVTAMYAHMGDHATRNDHIWGTGTTVNDPVGAGQQRWLMWSGT